MGDPNGKWYDFYWVAEKLFDYGIRILPLDAEGKILGDWREALSEEVKVLPEEELLAYEFAKGLAIALGTSLGGELCCRTFNRWTDYMNSVTLMGINSIPLAAAVKEGEKTSVLFRLKKEERFVLNQFEEIAAGVYDINSTGTIRLGPNLLKIPPTKGIKWIQEPVLIQDRPLQSNVSYFNLSVAGLIPPLF